MHRIGNMKFHSLVNFFSVTSRQVKLTARDPTFIIVDGHMTQTTNVEVNMCAREWTVNFLIIHLTVA